MTKLIPNKTKQYLYFFISHDECMHKQNITETGSIHRQKIGDLFFRQKSTHASIYKVYAISLHELINFQVNCYTARNVSIEVLINILNVNIDAIDIHS